MDNLYVTLGNRGCILMRDAVDSVKAFDDGCGIWSPNYYMDVCIHDGANFVINSRWFLTYHTMHSSRLLHV